MPTASDAFRAHAPAALRESAGGAVTDALDDLVARGAEAWPDLRVEPAAVVAQAARNLPPALAADALPAAIAALHAEDLHLACACASGSPAALSAFDRSILSGGALRPALKRIDASAAFADEVRQSLREKLLLAHP